MVIESTGNKKKMKGMGLSFTLVEPFQIYREPAAITAQPQPQSTDREHDLNPALVTLPLDDFSPSSSSLPRRLIAPENNLHRHLPAPAPTPAPAPHLTLHRPAASAATSVSISVDNESNEPPIIIINIHTNSSSQLHSQPISHASRKRSASSDSWIRTHQQQSQNPHPHPHLRDAAMVHRSTVSLHDAQTNPQKSCESNPICRAVRRFRQRVANRLRRRSIDSEEQEEHDPCVDATDAEVQLSVVFPCASFLQSTERILHKRHRTLFLVLITLLAASVPGAICLAFPMPGINDGWHLSQLYLLPSVILIAYQCSLFFDGILFSYFNYATFVSYATAKIQLLSPSPSVGDIAESSSSAVMEMQRRPKPAQIMQEAEAVIILDSLQQARVIFQLPTLLKVFVGSFLGYCSTVVAFVFITIACDAFPLPFSGPLSVSVTYIPFKCLTSYILFSRAIRKTVPESLQIRGIALDFLNQAYIAGVLFTTSTIVFFFISEFTVFTFYKVSGIWQTILLSTYQVVVLSVKVLSRIISKRNCRTFYLDEKRTAEFSAVWGNWCDYGCQLFVMMSLPSVSGEFTAYIYLIQQSLMILMQPLIDTQTGRKYVIRLLKFISPEYKHTFIEESMQINETYQRKASLQICCANFMSRLIACVTYVIFALICYYGPNREYIVPFQNLSDLQFHANMKFVGLSFLVGFVEMLLVRRVLFLKYSRDFLLDFTEVGANKAILMHSLYTSVLVFTQLAVIAHGNLLLRY